MTQRFSQAHQEVQSEYDALYKTAPIRDDDRGYCCHAEWIYKARPSANKALDIACGGGYFLKHLVNYYHNRLEVFGMDISSEALRLAKESCPSAILSVGVGESLSFQENFFDVVTCLGSLEHFVDINKSLQEMRRVLKPDGLLYVMVPNLFWYKDVISVLRSGNRLSRNQTHERFYCIREWAELFANNGLFIRNIEKYNGIARSRLKQRLKDFLIPLNLSYHIIFVAGKDHG